MASFYENIKEQVVAIKETIIELILDSKVFIVETWPLLIFLFGVLFAALWVSDPVPPRHIVMAVGPKNSADNIIGEKYKRYFERMGVTLELKNTNGSVQNYEELKDKNSPVEAAFVMTGIATKPNDSVVTLGSIDYEPLWCFYRGKDNFFNRDSIGIKSLIDKKINIGAIGSGTNFQSQKILEILQIDKNSKNFSTYPTSDATQLLIDGKLDAVCIVDSMDNLSVQKLLNEKEINLSFISRAEAFTKKIPSLETVKVPKSSLNIIEDIPSENKELLAATREILVDKNLHPAIQTLFLMAATHINGGETFFSKEGEFPTFKDNLVNRSEEAQTYYTKGAPYMVDWLPFWISEFVRRLFLTLLPLAAIAYPIVKSTPNYYKNRVRGKINKLYGGIKFFEQQLVESYEPSKLPEYIQKLKDIETEALKMKVPKSISQDYYTMRSSIDFISDKLLNGDYSKLEKSNSSPNQLELDLTT